MGNPAIPCDIPYLSYMYWTTTAPSACASVNYPIFEGLGLDGQPNGNGYAQNLNYATTQLKAYMQSTNMSPVVLGGIVADKEYFAKNTFQAGTTTVHYTNPESIVNYSNPRLMVVRPNDPVGSTIQRPCIMIASGGAFKELYGPEVQYALAADLAMRGYVAVYYEYRTGWCTNQTEWTKASYRALQDAIAATRYIVAKKSLFKVDTNNMFDTGHSAGGVLSLLLAYADEGTNYTGTTYTALGAYKARSNYAGAAYNFSLKATIPWAGALINPSTPGIGNILANNDIAKNCWYLPIHGMLDNLVNVNVGSIPSSTFCSGATGALNTEGPLKLKDRIAALGGAQIIPNSMVLNCTGGHGVFGAGTSTDACGPTGIFCPLATTRQLYDIASYTAFFCYFRMSGATIGSQINYVQPETNLFSTNPLFGYFKTGSCGISGKNEAFGQFSTSISSTLTLSPNPTRNNLNLTYNTTTTEDATITLYDLTGKAVLQTTETATEGTNNYNLQLTDLPTGMYIVQLQTTTQRLIQKVQVIR